MDGRGKLGRAGVGRMPDGRPAAGGVGAGARVREAPPPLRPGEVWLVEGGRVSRAYLANDGDEEAG